MLSLKQLQRFTETTAIKAGKLLLKEQSRARIIQFKDIQDIATTADLKSEKLIITDIKTIFPDHNILSEEAGIIDHKSEYTWVIDPLDGTKEYARGLPTYAVLIACQKGAQIITGCVYVPSSSDLYSAAQGSGAFHNNHSVRISQQSQLNQAIVFSHLPNHRLTDSQFALGWKTVSRIADSSYRLRGTNMDAVSLCWLAQGGIDAYIVPFAKGPNWWDLAPGLLIAQEAGAKITDLKGKPVNPHNLNQGIIASNIHLHPQLLRVLNS
ncbi:MAG: inositol monophosphatase [Candidatus Chisholmbacteria bacterium]|nr:inositol monophosphatase [Candidatus Chisholmbacteria bacterium]